MQRRAPGERTELAGVPARLLEVRQRLQPLRASAVPLLLRAGAQLKGQVASLRLDPVTQAIADQAAAIDALAFDLLVPVGLRAAALPRHRGAFREQVAQVARCTQTAWGATQAFLQEHSARAAAQGHALFEFSRVLRHLEQQLSTASQLSDSVCSQLLHGSTAATEVGRQGYLALSGKAGDLAGDIARLAAACGHARALRDHAVCLADDCEALAAMLRRQAQGMAPPLLRHLGGLIAPTVRDTPDRLRLARAAAAELSTSIAAAQAQAAAIRHVVQQFGSAAVALQAGL